MPHSPDRLTLIRRAHRLPADWSGERYELWIHESGAAVAVRIDPGETIAAAVSVDPGIDNLRALPYRTSAARALGQQLEQQREEWRPWATWIPGSQDYATPEEKRQQGRAGGTAKWAKEREAAAAR